MKFNYKILLLLFLFSGQFVWAQTPLRVDELKQEDNALGYNRDTLKLWIQDILHGGGGLIDTATISFTGNYQACGRFQNGQDIGFDKGLILSTGKVKNAEPPNSTGATSDAFNEFDPLNSSGDPDLLTMYNTIFNGSGGKDTTIFYTGDAAVIEFTYQPYGDEIVLEYVFASEEYPSAGVQPLTDEDLTGFNGSNQIFDLMGISMEKFGFHNLAFTDPTDPGGGPPEPRRWVTVQHINANSSPSYFQPNPSLGGVGLGTQFDGLTKTVGDLGPLRIRKKNTAPCSKYHVKIAIEDFYYNSPNEELLPSGFQLNSAVFLEKGSLRGFGQGAGNDQPGWSMDYYYTNTDLEGNLVENCNEIIATFTLERPINREYLIPFRVVLPAFRDKVQVSYDGGDILLDDTIRFFDGDSVKVIRLAAVNLDSDIPNTEFRYPLNPCDLTNPFGGGFSGSINFNLRNNEPFSFSANPKNYAAYCKETLELTITDVTMGGVSPIFYYWDGDVVSKENIFYQVQASPDYVPILVKDYCDNEANPLVQINNKPIVLEPIADAFLCGPGQSQNVNVEATMPDYSDYTLDHVRWYKVNTPLPNDPLGEADGHLITVVYDDAVGADIWTCGFEITDCCGGTITGSFIVNQSELSLGADQNICRGESKELIANAQAQTYAWYAVNNPGNILSTTNSVVVTPNITTEYALKILDLCDQEQIATITVIVDTFLPEIEIEPSTAEICAGETITLTANTALEYHWEPGGATSQILTLNPTVPDTYTYTLTASSAYCLNKEISATFTVYEIPSPEFSFTPNAEICTGEVISFLYGDDPAGKTFEWDFDDNATSQQTNPTYTYDNPGSYQVSLKVDQYICSDDTSIVINIDPLPAPDFIADVDSACLPVEVFFTNLSTDVANGAQYLWSFGDGNESQAAGSTSHEYTSAGIYTVSLTIHNTDRCAATTTIPNMIQVNANPKAAFEADPWISTLDAPDIFFQDSTISDDPIGDYLWDFGDGSTSTDKNPTHTYSQPGEFEVFLITKTIHGCADTTFATVVITLEIKLYFPNAFTPNNDGLNDVFEIKGTPITDYHIYIYDRTGTQVWSAHDFETQWDGKDQHGNAVQAGTYVYKIMGTDHNYKTLSFTGTVTVLK